MSLLHNTAKVCKAMTWESSHLQDSFRIQHLGFYSYMVSYMFELDEFFIRTSIFISCSIPIGPGQDICLNC